MEPTHHVAFPGVQFVWTVDFSPDGRVAYCLVDGSGVDLWAAGVSRWPQVLGGLLGVLLLVYALIVLRVRRRHQVKGEPHCRRCNYNLVSHAPDSVKKGAARRLPAAGTLCPECGVDVSKRLPRKGRSFVRRVWVATTFFLLCAAGYLSMFVLGVPRAVNSPDAPQLWSTFQHSGIRSLEFT